MGGLTAYTGKAEESCRNAAVLVDKTVKGPKSADLPTQQPTKIVPVDLKPLGLAVPPSILARADEIIE